MAKKVNLLIIDPERSFCADVPAAEQQVKHDGELCVPGAWDDFVRVGNLIDRLGGRLSDIHVTLDSHHPLHISHPLWYRAVNVNGLPKDAHPDPFTFLKNVNNEIMGYRLDMSTGQFVEIGTFTTNRRGMLPWTLDYLTSVDDGGRYMHTVWPPHCLIGTPGATIVEPLYESLLKWQIENCAYVDCVTKGSNPKVEHFSALRAEVADPMDPEGTGVNSRFLTTCMKADIILLCGVAGSHCVANTVTDMANEFNDPNDPANQSDEFIKKCVLLEDAISPVTGLENLQTDFVEAMKKRGMQVTTCADYLA
jgi:nicotinamidase-related amidase